MVPQIGHTATYQGRVVHIQDRANISMAALIGVPDDNGLMWPDRCQWVPWDDLEPTGQGGE